MELYNTHIVPLATMYFLAFCRYYNILQETLTNLYHTHYAIKLITDMNVWILFRVYCFLIHQKIEPDTLPWISCSQIDTQFMRLKEEYTDKYKDIIIADLYDSSLSQFSLNIPMKREETDGTHPLHDTYSTTQSIKCKYADFYFSKLCQQFTPLTNSIMTPEEATSDLDLNEEESMYATYYTQVILKAEVTETTPGYIVRRGGSFYNNIAFVPSSARFLSVEYSHPDMSSPIELELDPAWLYTGNEIMTPVFILRLLDHQPVMYFFDEDYVVKIMDSDCNIITLTSSYYILLTTAGYKINKMKEFDEAAVLVERPL